MRPVVLNSAPDDAVRAVPGVALVDLREVRDLALGIQSIESRGGEGEEGVAERLLSTFPSRIITPLRSMYSSRK